MSSPAEEVFTEARWEERARTYGDWRVDVLNVAFFDEKILGASTQRFDICFGERLAIALLLNPPVQVRASRHQKQSNDADRIDRRSQIPASETVRDSCTTMAAASTQMSLHRAPKMTTTTQKCRSGGMKWGCEGGKGVGRRVPLFSLASVLLWSPARSDTEMSHCLLLQSVGAFSGRGAAVVV